ncbi:MAG: hypothetical protein HYY16_00890 [Planctomycetes bacterium]|nr:hypothetical protein [Planctomycetota bacterium]
MSQGNGRTPREPFGQVAVRKGYVTQEQVRHALEVQQNLATTGQRHKLIGLVMLEMGMLGTTELIEVLKEIDQDLHSAAAPPSVRPSNS